MSSQRQTPQEDNNMNDINNNTALMTMDETDQGTNNGHLVTILKSENLEGVLPLAEDFIMSRIRFSALVTDKCASDISLVWEKLQQHGKKTPVLLNDFESRLEDKTSNAFGQSFKNWVTLGDRHRRQWNSYRIKVMKNWHCEPMCLLPAEKYPEDKPLSRDIIRRMADLSALVSANEGRELLIYEIDYRSQGIMRGGRRSYRPDLILSDVDEAIKKAKTKQQAQEDHPKKKRKLVDEEHDDTLVDEDLAPETSDDVTSLESALATLEPKQRLSSEAIFRVLGACVPPDCYVVDPLFLDPTFKSQSSAPRVRKTMPENISSVIAPVHHSEQSHWTVIIFNRHQPSAQHLDSFPNLKSTIDERHFHQCMKNLDKDYKEKAIHARECPIQSNGYDCGVHVLANALYQVTESEAPPAHDCALWRRICIAILSGRVDQVPEEDSKPLDTSSYSANLIWKKPASLGTGHHEAVEKGFNALQWERKRNREEEGELVRMERVLTSLSTSRDDPHPHPQPRRSSSAHPHPHQSLNLQAAQRILAAARERCTRQRGDLDSEHDRWEEVAREWQSEIRAEAEWTEGLLAGMAEKR